MSGPSSEHPAGADDSWRSSSATIRFKGEIIAEMMPLYEQRIEEFRTTIEWPASQRMSDAAKHRVAKASDATP